MIVPMLVTRFLNRAVRLYANKTAIVCGKRRFTYAEYGQRVNRLSNALLRLGVQKGERVAFLSPNCHRLLEAYYGVPQIGAVLVCLNIRLSSPELAFIVNDAEPKVLCVDWELVPLIAPIMDALPSVQHFILLSDGVNPSGMDWPDYEELLAAASPETPLLPAIAENELAEMFYTSGTTGKPKGVMLTHRNLYANAVSWTIALNVRDTDVHLHCVPLFHVNGWGTAHSVTGQGGTHVLTRQFRPEKVFELIQQERVTVSAMVPTMLNALVNHPDYASYDLSSWERVAVGGAPCPTGFVRAAQEKLGVDAIVGYGMTEACPLLTLSSAKSYLRDLPEDEWFRLRAKTGLEVFGVELRVVDKEGNEVRHDGQQVGEIIVRGDNIMQGYWKDPETTAQVIVDGWLHTGDLATIDGEDYVLIVDRLKDIIISGGENIASTEIEEVIYTHPAVLEVAVIGVPDEHWGEVPKALVVLKPECSVKAEALMEHCATQLARFKVPKTVEFMETLPKNGMGKIMKTILREQYWQGYDTRVH